MGFNPHPPLTGFPVALLSAVVACEVLAIYLRQHEILSKLSQLLLVATLVIAPLTYLSGYLGADHASQTFVVPEEVIGTHEAYGRFFLLLLVVTFILRLVATRASANRHGLMISYFVMLLATFSCLVFVSFLGGELVFSYGAGVSAKLSKP